MKTSSAFLLVIVVPILVKQHMALEIIIAVCGKNVSLEFISILTLLRYSSSLQAAYKSAAETPHRAWEMLRRSKSAGGTCVAKLVLTMLELTLEWHPGDRTRGPQQLSQGRCVTRSPIH
jgi:hypothetical protein